MTDADGGSPAAYEPMVMPAPARNAGRSVWAVSEPSQERRGFWPRLAFGIWLAGALLLALHVVVASVSVARRFRGLPEVFDPEVLTVLDECRARMGVRTRLRLVEAADVGSPALHGILRPRLLLPSGFSKAFSPAEPHFVFLHELAHVKRRDVLLNWIVAFLQVVHWFNPLLWLGFIRWRADRELACDALALEMAGAARNKEYGRTILRLLEGCTHRTAAPGLVGILEDSSQMKRRIAMIAEFTGARRSSALALMLLGVLGLVTLTDAPSRYQQGRAMETNPSMASVAAAVSPDNRPENGQATLRGKVVDENGAPVADAYVTLDKDHWVTTDASGRFVMENAPLTGQYRVTRPGFFTTRDRTLTAGEAEQVVTLRRTIGFRGKVLAEETRKPIEAFSIVPGAAFDMRMKTRWLWTKRQCADSNDPCHPLKGLCRSESATTQRVPAGAAPPRRQGRRDVATRR